MGATPKRPWAVQTGFDGLEKKREDKVEGVQKREWIWEESREGVNMTETQ